MLRPTILLLLASLIVVLPMATGQPDPVIRYSPSQPVAGQPIHFAVDGVDNATAWNWDFGDGRQSQDASPTHAYEEAGSFAVRVGVTIEDQLHEAQAGVQVRPAAGLGLTYPSWMYWLMPALVGLVLLGLGLVVLLRGQPTIYNRVFFLLYGASAVKSFSETAFYFSYLELGNAAAVSGALVANRAIGFLYPHFFVWFVLVFPRPLRPWLKDGWRGSIVLLLSLPFFILEFALDLSSEAVRSLFNAYVSVLALVSLGLLVYHAWETDGAEERHRIRLLAASFFLVVFATIVVTGFQLLGQEELALTSGLVFVPLLEIMGCLLLMYAILRYQLLGVEFFLKRVTRYTSFAIAIGSVFVIVSNSVEQIFESRFLGEFRFGFLVAGFISTIMLYPVQKATERLANRLFPDAAAGADAMAGRRLEIYEAQLRYALLDGTLKEKELSMLHALRDSLQLRAEELQHVGRSFPGLDVRVLLPRTA